MTTELNFVHKFYSIKIDISDFRSNTFDQIPRWFFLIIKSIVALLPFANWISLRLSTGIVTYLIRI